MRTSLSSLFVALRRLGVLLAGVLITVACGHPSFDAVELHAEDMCSNCRMAISERRWAAQYITRDGEAVKFDDIGCMRDYIKVKESMGLIAALYVADYDSGKWLDGTSARYLRAAGFKTPMGAGIVSVAGQERLAVLAADNNAEVLTFEQVFGSSDASSLRSTK